MVRDPVNQHQSTLDSLQKMVQFRSYARSRVREDSEVEEKYGTDNDSIPLVCDMSGLGNTSR